MFEYDNTIYDDTQEAAGLLAAYDLAQVDGNCSIYDAQVICIEDTDHRVVHHNIGQFIGELRETQDVTLVEGTPEASIDGYAIPAEGVETWENPADHLQAGLVIDRMQRLERLAAAQEFVEDAAFSIDEMEAMQARGEQLESERLYAAMDKLDAYWDYIAVEKRNEALIANLHRAAASGEQRVFLVAGADHFTSEVRRELERYSFVQLTPLNTEDVDPDRAAHYENPFEAERRQELKQRWLAARALVASAPHRQPAA